MPNPGSADFDAGVTALSLLAFLGAGYTHLSEDRIDGIHYGNVVRRGLWWLTLQQDPEGCIGPRTRKYMYNHAIGTLALSRAYGRTGSPVIDQPTRKAVAYLLAAQNPGSGWRYSARSLDNDTSVTGWSVQALVSAKNAGITVPSPAFDGAWAWFDQITDRAYGSTEYSLRSFAARLKCGIPSRLRRWEKHESMTAMAVACRILMRQTTNFGEIPNGNGLLHRDPPRWDGNAIDFYYWYCGTMSVFQ